MIMKGRKPGNVQKTHRPENAEADASRLFRGLKKRGIGPRVCCVCVRT